MKAIAGIYLKALFLMAIFWTIVCSPVILVGLMFNDLLLYQAAFLGLAAIIIGSLHILAIKRRGFALTAENLKTVQSKSMVVGYEFEEAVSRCMMALRQLKSISIQPETCEESGSIQARTSRRFEIGGELIRIHVRRRSEQSTFITLTCRPALYWPPFDYGRCLRVTTKIMDFLQGKHEIGASAPTQKAAR
jgi:hypothetical protein